MISNPKVNISMKDEIIKYWAGLIDVEHKDNIIGINHGIRLNESRIPDDDETIEKSFGGDISDEKFYPTVEFLEKIYDIMNKRLFNDHLPKGSNLIFKMNSSTRADYVGAARYRTNYFDKTVIPLGIILNSSVTMTIHEWMEVIIHEMIHILDYQDYPDHFLGYMRRIYDPHGTWFLEEGKKFESLGFNIEKTCTKEYGINTDNQRIKKMIDTTSLIYLEGYRDAVIASKDNDLENNLFWLMAGVKNNRYRGLKNIRILKSNNPKISKLKRTKLKNASSGFSFWYYNDKFINDFGPFEEKKVYTMEDIKEKFGLNEDKDEVEFDDMNHIDDEYTKKMYDNIEGIVDIKKIDDGEYEVSIW